MRDAQGALAIEPVRVGLIGVGDISRVYLNTLARSPLIELRALATRNPDSLATSAARHGAVACDVASLLDDPAIELVVNLTPGKVHEEINGAILAAGKNVYSEKPLALTLAAALTSPTRNRCATTSSTTRRCMTRSAVPTALACASNTDCPFPSLSGPAGSPTGLPRLFCRWGRGAATIAAQAAQC